MELDQQTWVLLSAQLGSLAAAVAYLRGVLQGVKRQVDEHHLVLFGKNYKNGLRGAVAKHEQQLNPERPERVNGRD